jgi:hypothetical protein
MVNVPSMNGYSSPIRHNVNRFAARTVQYPERKHVSNEPFFRCWSPTKLSKIGSTLFLTDANGFHRVPSLRFRVEVILRFCVTSIFLNIDPGGYCDDAMA